MHFPLPVVGMPGQPIGPSELNEHHPFANLVIEAWNFGDSLAGKKRGLVCTLNGAAAVKPYQGHLGVGGFATTSDYLALPDLGPYLGARWTLLFMLSNVVDQSTNGFGDLSTETSEEHYHYFGTAYLTGGSQSRVSAAVPSQPFVARPHALVMAMDANGVGNNSLFAWRDTSTSGAAPGGSTNGWKSTSRLGSGASFVYPGAFFGFVVLKGTLQPTQARLLALDPWALFKPVGMDGYWSDSAPPPAGTPIPWHLFMNRAA